MSGEPKLEKPETKKIQNLNIEADIQLLFPHSIRNSEKNKKRKLQLDQ